MTSRRSIYEKGPLHSNVQLPATSSAAASKKRKRQHSNDQIFGEKIAKRSRSSMNKVLKEDNVQSMNTTCIQNKITDYMLTGSEENSEIPGSPSSTTSTSSSELLNSSLRGEVTPHSAKRPIKRKYAVIQKREKLEMRSSRPRLSSLIESNEVTCPLPEFHWANRHKIWEIMLAKNALTVIERNPNMLETHPSLHPNMRAILLDWLNEVSEVYKLHRETYYLAMDYLDRFLSKKMEITKAQLQLLGITCLFIAAKVEEIYPPKINEFAYVTDGACTEEDILEQELIVYVKLKWQVNPVTIIEWLGIFMQLNVTIKKLSICDRPSTSQGSVGDNNSNVSQSVQDGISFIFPQFSGYDFTRACQLIDLCALDLGILKYSYAVIAASSIAHIISKEIAVQVSGFSWNKIECCYNWMTPFYTTISKDPTAQINLAESYEPVTSCGLRQICPNIKSDESYIIQTHSTSIDLLEASIKLRDELELIDGNTKLKIDEIVPATTIVDRLYPEGLLTPPMTDKKELIELLTGETLETDKVFSTTDDDSDGYKDC